MVTEDLTSFKMIHLCRQSKFRTLTSFRSHIFVRSNNTDQSLTTLNPFSKDKVSTYTLYFCISQHDPFLVLVNVTCYNSILRNDVLCLNTM